MLKSDKTYSAKPSEVVRSWYVFDASEIPLGRICSEIAQRLMGKQKPMFTPHIDTGDYCVVINSDSLVSTGQKTDQKMYHRHSGYIGNLHSISQKDQITKDSTKVIYAAVRGMLPVNRLRDGRLERLKIFTGSEHTHEAQKPQKVSMK